MGIGISYTGHDGRQRHFDAADGADAKRQLSDVMPAARRHTGDALRDAMSRLPGMTPPPQERAKVMPGGSVVESRDGLCLRGEETSPLVEGVKMFASVNGSKGFKSIAEIDPPGAAATCGPQFGCDDADEDASVAKAGEAVRIPFVSRTKMEKDETNGLITIYEFVREMVFSPAGRLVGCTKERRRVVGSFVPGSGSSSGKYGVRLFFDAFPGDPEHPTPLAFAFGKESDLDTYVESTDSFGCNTGSDDPPVKIIGVTEGRTEVIQEGAGNASDSV